MISECIRKTLSVENLELKSKEEKMQLEKQNKIKVWCRASLSIIVTGELMVVPMHVPE